MSLRLRWLAWLGRMAYSQRRGRAEVKDQQEQRRATLPPSTPDTPTRNYCRATWTGACEMLVSWSRVGGSAEELV